MFVLALDTATAACSVVVAEWTDGTSEAVELCRREVVDARRHGEVLAPLIAETLQVAGVPAKRLGAIVTGVGPGPYTSLRVGIVTAAALADALRIPAYGVCSLDGVPGTADGRYVAATDARRREVYWARYAGGERITGPAVAPPAELAEELMAGERIVGAGAQLYADVFGAAFDPDGPRFPDPVCLIVAAGADFGTPPGPLVPLYLRRPDATPRRAA